MSGDDSREDREVTSVNGSFYKDYKSSLSEFLTFVSKVGRTGISEGHLAEDDLHAVQRGLSLLQGRGEDLLGLLPKLIDEEAPSFWDESLLDTILGLLGGVYLVAQHSGITKSAEQFLSHKLSKVGREAKEKKDQQRTNSQKAALSEFLSISGPIQPSKLADSIFKDPAELDRFNRLLDAKHVKRFSDTTAKRLLRQMRDHAKGSNRSH